MKRLIFTAVFMTAIFIPIAVSEGQVMPVCSIIELKDDKDIDNKLEDYIVGVVAGEMPVNFPYEALKAQAVAARTYAVRQINENSHTKYKDIAQAYVSVDRMKEMWGSNFDKYYEKVRGVVYSTAGEILEYNNEPILAAFCSTTNGYTQECSGVWSEDLPYLRSVKSEGDELSPYYYGTVTLSSERFGELFGSCNFEITEINEAGYVKSVKIGNLIYSGEEIRSMAGLKSASFDISVKGDDIVFTTRGYGHGVGMSQYGACYMANNGSDYRDILTHYYSNANIKNL